MKPYQFIAILGIITMSIGVVATVFNDKVTGIGLITAGMGDMAISVSMVERQPDQP